MAVVSLSSAASEAGAEDPNAKIERQVFEDLQAGKGVATFWAVMGAKADLTPAPGIEDNTARGQFVYDRLTSVANESQANLRAFLESREVDFEPFWILNAIKITGDEALLREVAARPDVERVLADRTWEVPEPLPGEDLPKVDVVEWNIDRINAPQVWSEFGDRGEGMVVANIDTGAQFNHTALVAQYRGNLGGGSFDHNYNWFDPSEVCGNPSLVPCDNHGHGTHTMGTMVGDDGDPGPNQIGVAPHARWIAAKGCESGSCSSAALLASAEWILAPTDLNGQNPRPDLRPHVVNNSWGGGSGDPWYQASVDAWIASGIFPAFSNGNNGPGCGSSGSPGDYVQSYSAGAFDINNNIAGFSSRGPSAFAGELKPNIAAPGVSVRSSVPTDSYTSFSGTSMASPHVAATVALVWSAALAIERDIAATRTLLDDTAVDTSDLTCEGTADDNNVWGEGKLDAHAAVNQAPRGPTGSLGGTVTDENTGDPIEGATVEAEGPIERTTSTDADGRYGFPALSTGTYEVTASKFGYLSETATVEIAEDETTTQDFALVPAPSHTVSGHVRDEDEQGLENATVTILGTPIPPATTDADGFYSFESVPEGTYDVRAEAGGCFDPQTQELVVDGDETLDFTLQQRTDEFGYFCRVTTPDYVEATNVLPLTSDDTFLEVTLPFAFTFYGQTYSSAFVSTNGYLNFLAGNSFPSNTSIPSTGAPNAAIYPYWDDLFVDGSASVRSELLGSEPDRRFVIEWRNVHYFGDTTRRVDFEVILHENGRIQTEYRNIADDGREKGNSATIGIENEEGSDAFENSFNEAVIDDPEFAVLYQLPPSGFIQGTVTDANDDEAVAAATVMAIRDGEVIRQVTTDGDGFYRTQVPLGTYTVEASKTNYETGSATVALNEEDETVTQDFSLRTARGEVSPDSLELVVPQGETRTRTLTLENSGSADMTWETAESGGGPAQALAQQRPDPSPDDPPWEDVADYPFPVIGNIADAWDGTVYSVTGAGGPAFTFRNELFSYDPATDTWTELSPIATARDLPSGAIIDGRFYVVGGSDNTFTIVSSLEIYDIVSDTWTTGAPMPIATADAEPVVLDGQLYLIGGFQEGTGRGVDDVWVYDPAADAWSAAAPYPEPISRTHCGALDGFIYCAGGRGADGSGTTNGYVYDPAAEAWSPIAPLPQGLWAGYYVAANGMLLVSGGLTDGAGSITTEGFAYDPASDSWSTLPNANNTVYRGASACGFYRIGGATPDFTFVADVERLPGFDECREAGDAPWLESDPTSGTLAPGASQEIAVTVDTTDLEPGAYEARLTIRTNSARQPNLRVPVTLIVPAYYQAANAGDGPAYTDGLGDTWEADQAYSAGSWGYVNERARAASTRRPISGTEDDPLYRTQRVDPLEYRFDGLPEGVYQVELRFAEIQGPGRPNRRLHDVIIEGDLVLPAHDIAREVGAFAADDHTFFVPVTDGQLNVQLVGRRGQLPPVINAIRVAERPDR